MTAAEALEIAREAVFVTIMIGAPVMGVALIVGLAISLIQALTQVQEMTLTFVPKILVIFLSLLVFFPFMLSTLTDFTERLADRIVHLS
ncbi:MAG: flagellar biosynthesis protein FliQ [Alphaproteobacteria bacterium]